MTVRRSELTWWCVAFEARRKTCTEAAAVMQFGKLCHIRAVVTKKARLPSIDSCMWLTISNEGAECGTFCLWEYIVVTVVIIKELWGDVALCDHQDEHALVITE